jgi:membrane-associated phospholipid phosphatase
MRLLLKYTIREKRPDSDNRDSFPSGHTASAFSGASFIHKRYGIKQAIVPYILATFTGYSRVKENKHHIRDVIAGAVISSAFSLYFADKYNLPIMANSDGNGLAISLKKNF